MPQVKVPKALREQFALMDESYCPKGLKATSAMRRAWELMAVKEAVTHVFPMSAQRAITSAQHEAMDEYRSLRDDPKREPFAGFKDRLHSEEWEEGGHRRWLIEVDKLPPAFTSAVFTHSAADNGQIFHPPCETPGDSALTWAKHLVAECDGVDVDGDYGYRFNRDAHYSPTGQTFEAPLHARFTSAHLAGSDLGGSRKYVGAPRFIEVTQSYGRDT